MDKSEAMFFLPKNDSRFAVGWSPGLYIVMLGHLVFGRSENLDDLSSLPPTKLMDLLLGLWAFYSLVVALYHTMEPSCNSFDETKLDFRPIVMIQILM